MKLKSDYRIEWTVDNDRSPEFDELNYCAIVSVKRRGTVHFEDGTAHDTSEWVTVFEIGSELDWRNPDTDARNVMEFNYPDAFQTKVGDRLSMTIDRFELETNDVVTWTFGGKNNHTRVTRVDFAGVSFVGSDGENGDILFEHGYDYNDRTKFALSERGGRQVVNGRFI